MEKNGEKWRKKEKKERFRRVVRHGNSSGATSNIARPFRVLAKKTQCQERSCFWDFTPPPDTILIVGFYTQPTRVFVRICVAHDPLSS